MKIHSVFHAANPRSAWIAELLNTPDVRDGGFARVAPMTGHSVLKATCCTATRLLFQDLLTLRKAGKPIPEHIPAVMRSFGASVRDTEGIAFNAYEVERLFDIDDQEGSSVARVTGKAHLASWKPGYRKQVARLNTNYLQDLQLALKEEQAVHGSCTWEGSENIALAMALRTSGELKDSFLFLARFVRAQKQHLDLLGQGNVMLNMFGEPCLGDPVCDDSLAQTMLPSTQAYGQCIAVMAPEQVRGLAVTLAPRASGVLTERQLEDVSSACLELGLSPTTFQWGGALLNEYLSQSKAVVNLWSYPNVAANLRNGSYDRIFLA